MWIKTQLENPNYKNSLQFEKLVNLATAAAINLRENGVHKWNVVVRHERIITPHSSGFGTNSALIGIFDGEQEAKDAHAKAMVWFKAAASARIGLPQNEEDLAAGKPSASGGKSMWVKALNEHPKVDGYSQLEKLVNIAEASAVLIFRDRYKKWHVAVQHPGGCTSIELFDTEAEAKEAVAKIAEKLQAAPNLNEL